MQRSRAAPQTVAAEAAVALEVQARKMQGPEVEGGGLFVIEVVIVTCALL